MLGCLAITLFQYNSYNQISNIIRLALQTHKSGSQIPTNLEVKHSQTWKFKIHCQKEEFLKLIFGEEGGLDKQTDTDSVVKLIVGEQALPIAIVPVKI